MFITSPDTAVCCVVPLAAAFGDCKDKVLSVPVPVPSPDWIVRVAPPTFVSVPPREPCVAII
jgi:hypothetical protein